MGEINLPELVVFPAFHSLLGLLMQHQKWGHAFWRRAGLSAECGQGLRLTSWQGLPWCQENASVRNDRAILGHEQHSCLCVPSLL